MPSTGTAGFTISRDGMINASLRTLRVLQEGQVANATQLQTGGEAINTILKYLQSKGLPIWTYALIAVPMQPNKTTYTLGPVGADVITVRPLRILEGCFIRLVVNGVFEDTPLTLLTRTQYLQYTAKNGGPGIPNSIYYDAHIDSGAVTSPSTGYGDLTVYVMPSDASRTIWVNVQRPIYDMTAGTDEFDLPSEWFLLLRYWLAEIMADEEEVPENRLARVRAQAAEYRESLLDWAIEAQPTAFTLDMSAYQKFGRRR